MKELAHLRALKQKHVELKRVIKTANDNFHNEVTIKKLKKQKLLLKEKIVDIEEVV